MGVEPTRNGATIRRVNHFTTATKLFPNSIAWRRMLLYYIEQHSSTLFYKKSKIFYKKTNFAPTLETSRRCFLPVVYLYAMASISTRAPLGSAATCTKERAGGLLLKYLAYTPLMASKSLMSVAKIVVFTTCIKP